MKNCISVINVCFGEKELGKTNSAKMQIFLKVVEVEAFPSRWEQTKQTRDQLASCLGSFPRRPLPVLGGSNLKQYDFRRTNRMRRRGPRGQEATALGNGKCVWFSFSHLVK